MARRNTRTKSEQSQTKRDNNMSRGEYTVKYPQEYVSYAKHPIVTSVRSRHPVQGTSINARFTLALPISAVIPVDKDEEIVDTSVNNYRLIKSLTAGARYYTETTVLAYMTNLRAMILVAHEYAGRLKALRSFDRVGDPSLFAYRARVFDPDLATETESTLIGDLPKYESIFLEMISDMNAIPVFESGEFGFMKEMFLYAFLDESHPGGDVYSPTLYSVQYAEYDDSLKALTGMSDLKYLNKLNLEGLYGLFAEIRETFVMSVDMSNLSADMLGVLPSSRKDWMTHFDMSSPYLVPMTKQIATIISSSDVLGVTDPGSDTINAGGTRIIRGAPTLPSWSTASDVKGRLLSCDTDELELSAMMLCHHHNASDILSTGYALTNVIFTHYSSAGTMSRLSLIASMADAVSAVQSTAEQGFKRVAALWARYNSLPKVYFDDYGTGLDWANVLWSPMGIREIPMPDLANGIKVLNSINHRCINTAVRDR